MLFYTIFTGFRRDLYGQKWTQRRFEYPDNSGEECGGVLSKILYEPGVAMTHKAITIGQTPKKLWKNRKIVTFSRLDLAPQQSKFSVRGVEADPVACTFV